MKGKGTNQKVFGKELLFFFLTKNISVHKQQPKPTTKTQETKTGTEKKTRKQEK
jgi:hypothetical protein